MKSPEQAFPDHRWLDNSPPDGHCLDDAAPPSSYGKPAAAPGRRKIGVMDVMEADDRTDANFWSIRPALPHV
jgi:hypothetical protein